MQQGEERERTDGGETVKLQTRVRGEKKKKRDEIEEEKTQEVEECKSKNPSSIKKKREGRGIKSEMKTRSRVGRLPVLRVKSRLAGRLATNVLLHNLLENKFG